MGIDLTASTRKESAVALLHRGRASIEWLGPDHEIVGRVTAITPRTVAIDAPLSWPGQRNSLRECDREVRRLGVGILPPTLGPMRLLTTRAIALTEALRSNAVPVIETYPRAVHRLMGWVGRGGRPGARELGYLFKALRLRLECEVNEHVIDALTCAWVACLYLRNETVELGDPKEGTISLPRACLTPSTRSPRTSRRIRS